MLVIRPEQMELFRRIARQPFEAEMLAHGKRFSPRLSEVLGDEQLRVALRRAIDRATGYGFTNRGPVRLYIELMFLFGSGFDSDPQYRWASEILRGDQEQMQRANELYEHVLDYQARVSGPDKANTRRALNELLTFARSPAELSSPDFADGMVDVMRRIFPEKAAYVGEAHLRVLISEGSAIAGKLRFPAPRGAILIVALMFAFGHGCTDDPLYPWIARTLADERITDPAARAMRLEKKAITWLDHVLHPSSRPLPA